MAKSQNKYRFDPRKYGFKIKNGDYDEYEKIISRYKFADKRPFDWWELICNTMGNWHIAHWRDMSLAHKDKLSFNEAYEKRIIERSTAYLGAINSESFGRQLLINIGIYKPKNKK